MCTRIFKRVIVLNSLMLIMALPALAQSVQAESPDDLRIEMPAHGRVRIENQFGDIETQVWKENFVSVWTVVQDGVAFKRSPVVIENRDKLLVVSIVRRLTDPPVAIKLNVKLPENANVEIVTGKNSTTMRGIPSSTAVRSGAGDVNVQFHGAPNADINARSVSGFVKAELPQLQTNSGHALLARVGAGGQTLRITTQSGTILLTALNEPVVPVVHRTFPEPENSETPRKAAGTPAPILDAQEISEGDIVRVDSQLVALNMSVIDKNTNRGLLGLTKSDFRLFENGTEQQILQFDSSSAPFDLILLIDISGSTREVLKLIRAAALRFVDAARPSDRIGIVTFAGSPTLISPLTLDRRLLHQRLNGIETATLGDTKLYDATAFTVNHVLSDPKNRRRTAIIVMSDGLDGSIEGVRGDGSKLQFNELLGQIQEFDGVLYALWLNTEYEALSPLDTQPEAFDAGHDRMREMSDSGGGIFYEVERLEDLAGAYERVVADLGTVYSLAYRPLDKSRDGRWRAIRVNVDRPDAIARGKRGYYAN